MNLVVITPDSTLFDGEVASSTFPGAKGSFQVLNSHAPLISALEQGVVKYQPLEGNEASITISGGVVEVVDNSITVLVESVIEE